MSLKDIINDPISEVGGRIPVIIFWGYVQDKFTANFAKADSFDLLDFDSSLDIGTLKVIDSQTGNEEASFLFFLVVIELENGAAHVDGL